MHAPPELLAEHARIEHELADPAVHSDQDAARRLGKRYAELTPVVEAHKALEALEGDLSAARELADQDDSIRAEIPGMEAQRTELEDTLRLLLLPRDPNDDRDRGEGRVAAGLAVEGRDADEPVHAPLPLQPAVGVATPDLEGG